MQFVVITTVAFITVVQSNVIPTVLIDQNLTVRSAIKPENYKNSWINNNEPLQVCRAVEASLEPAVESRFCIPPEEVADENLGDYYVTFGDIQNRNAWLKEKEIRDASPVESRHFEIGEDNRKNVKAFTPITQESTWAYDKSACEANSGNYLVGYLNPKNIAVLQEPAEEDVEVFFGIDDLLSLNVPIAGIDNSDEKTAVIVGAILPSIISQSNDLVKENLVAIHDPKVSSVSSQCSVQNQSQNDQRNPIIKTTSYEQCKTTKNEDMLKKQSTKIPDDGKNSLDHPEVTTVLAEVPDQSQKCEASIGKLAENGLKKTNEIMSKTLDKLKQVEDFENIDKSVEKCVNVLNDKVSLETRMGKQQRKNKIDDTMSLTLL